MKQRLLFLLLILVFWLMGWPTKCGPYPPTLRYFVVLGCLLILWSASLIYVFQGNTAPFLFWISKRKRTYLISLGLLTGLLATEIFIRGTKLADWGGGIGPYQSQYCIGGYFFNAKGFRGPLLPTSIRKSKTVIMALGDSITFGHGVRWEDTYLQKLNRSLNRHTENHTYQTINASKPGWNTLNEANYLKDEGHLYRPSALIVQFTLNDAEIPPTEYSYDFKTLTSLAGERFLLRSHLYFFLLKVYNSTFNPYENHIRGLYEDDKPGWLYCLRSLEEISRLCQERI